MKKIILLVFLIMVPISLSAQTLGGTWTKTLVGAGYIPVEMAFADTSTGFIAAYTLPYGSDMKIYYTLDGARTIDSNDLSDNMAGGYSFMNAFCLSPDDYIIVPAIPGVFDPVFYSNDAGKDWNMRNPPTYFDPITEGTIGESVYTAMFSVDTGVVLSNEDGGKFPRQAYFISHDGDSTFQLFGDTIPREVAGGFAPNAQDLFAISDTLSSYMDEFNWKQFLFHSTDSGKGWSPIYPIDTNNWKQWTSYTPMQPGFGSEHYFLTGGRVTDTIAGERNLIDDYLESTDDGSTWNINSNVSGGRMFRIANPAPNVLWAAVGRVPQVRKGIFYDTGTYRGTPVKLVDSMFVSLNNGKTWTKDGTTFADDTICAMRWLTATNGYVVTYRDSSTYLYHFSGSIDTTHLSVSTQSANFHNHPVTLTAFPDPTKDLVHVSIPYESSLTSIHVFDVVEREMHPQTSFEGGELTVDATNLASGSYYMQIEGNSGYTYLVRFSRQP